MKTKAVIDRFEGDKAVLAMGEEQDRRVVLKSFLPKGAKEGDWLKIDVEDDRVLSASLDPSETGEAKSRIADKLAQLRKGEHRSQPGRRTNRVTSTYKYYRMTPLRTQTVQVAPPPLSQSEHLGCKIPTNGI